MLDEANRPKLELRSLQTAAPGAGAARHVEGLMKASGIRVEHLADDRDYYKGVCCLLLVRQETPEILDGNDNRGSPRNAV